MKTSIITLATILLGVYVQSVAAQAPFKLQYLSPRPDAQFVSPGTTIAFRVGELIDEQTVDSALFRVVGSRSGRHYGTAILADDAKTVIFKPEQPFWPGDKVRVTISQGITTVTGQIIEPVTFEFTISSQQALPRNEMLNYQQPPRLEGSSADLSTTNSPPYVTVPADFPTLTVTSPAINTSAGYNLLTAWPLPIFPNSSISYLLIVDNLGDPVYYKRQIGWVLDFKKQPNGSLTYFAAGEFKEMDNTYTIIDTYQAGNGYTTDVHDLQLLANGNALLMIYDDQIKDMSQIVPGGHPAATVTGLVIQELDTSKNVVFEWRSWDHFLITDTVVSLTTPVVDYVHGNSVELDVDGNLLISSRHLDEITKINRQTGDIIWRLGGKNNQFTFVNDTPPYFHFQHDSRRLANGNISLFDNRTNLLPAYSRAVEYQLDEGAKTATLVWQYRNTPDTYSFAMGNAQRLPNGNTLIGWGTGALLTEAQSDGSKAFELALAAPNINYRSFRFPWQGDPATPPTLVAGINPFTVTLSYSWNGATEIAYYRIYGGDQPQPTTLVMTQTKTGFETTTALPAMPDQFCYYRVMPINNLGQTTHYSNEVDVCRPPLYLPLISKN
jgi:hypothetical protein